MGHAAYSVIESGAADDTATNIMTSTFCADWWVGSNSDMMRLHPTAHEMCGNVPRNAETFVMPAVTGW
eukprot:CAMPEP_0197467730 /NCGR_PEP_ID=MMETSP1175-20131217/65718_1 /TAXON_ID=1003142 /ORGANISM="Triceratium dubium, Strain CCMP147" /LENGTH=67 /DNA_ID=CAMNT_0043003811 /DNA_START=1274 /DNA_END=1474 /DNA_ORIENTATION=+